MGCHPKPVDFHSIIFQDGEIAAPTSYIQLYCSLDQVLTTIFITITLWWTNIAMENGYL